MYVCVWKMEKIEYWLISLWRPQEFHITQVNTFSFYIKSVFFLNPDNTFKHKVYFKLFHYICNIGINKLFSLGLVPGG